MNAREFIIAFNHVSIKFVRNVLHSRSVCRLNENPVHDIIITLCASIANRIKIRPPQFQAEHTTMIIINEMHSIRTAIELTFGIRTSRIIHEQNHYKLANAWAPNAYFFFFLWNFVTLQRNDYYRTTANVILLFRRVEIYNIFPKKTSRPTDMPMILFA